MSSPSAHNRFASWAQTADPRRCEGCHELFAPTHPRQTLCGREECPGRRPRPRTPRRARTPPRGIGIQGVFGDVLLLTHRREYSGERDELLDAVRDWIDAERAGTVSPVELRVRLLDLVAAAASRTVALDRARDDPAPG